MSFDQFLYWIVSNPNLFTHIAGLIEVIKEDRQFAARYVAELVEEIIRSLPSIVEYADTCLDADRESMLNKIRCRHNINVDQLRRVFQLAQSCQHYMEQEV